jgi:hypothetical protein
MALGNYQKYSYKASFHLDFWPISLEILRYGPGAVRPQHPKAVPGRATQAMANGAKPLQQNALHLLRFVLLSQQVSNCIQMH